MAKEQLGLREWSERMWTRHASTDKLVACTMAFPETNLETVTAGVGFVMTFANITLVDTADGPVAVDTGAVHKGKLLLVRVLFMTCVCVCVCV